METTLPRASMRMIPAPTFNFLASLINGNPRLAKYISLALRPFNFLASLINGNRSLPFFVMTNVFSAFNFLASLINGNYTPSRPLLLEITILLTS